MNQGFQGHHKLNLSDSNRKWRVRGRGKPRLYSQRGTRMWLDPEERLLGALDIDAAGDGVNFDAASTVAHVGAERVLALLFNHDRNLGANLAGDGAGGKMEAGAGRHGDIHGTGDGLQVPIAVSAGI